MTSSSSTNSAMASVRFLMVFVIWRFRSINEFGLYKLKSFNPQNFRVGLKNLLWMFSALTVACASGPTEEDVLAKGYAQATAANQRALESEDNFMNCIKDFASKKSKSKPSDIAEASVHQCRPDLDQAVAFKRKSIETEMMMTAQRITPSRLERISTEADQRALLYEAGLIDRARQAAIFIRSSGN